jgi:hypothetical protein
VLEAFEAPSTRSRLGSNFAEPRTVARLIERNMAEDDAGDPLLESYQ